MAGTRAIISLARITEESIHARARALVPTFLNAPTLIEARAIGSRLSRTEELSDECTAVLHVRVCSLADKTRDFESLRFCEYSAKTNGVFEIGKRTRRVLRSGARFILRKRFFRPPGRLLTRVKVGLNYFTFLRCGAARRAVNTRSVRLHANSGNYPGNCTFQVCVLARESNIYIYILLVCPTFLRSSRPCISAVVLTL